MAAKRKTATKEETCNGYSEITSTQEKLHLPTDNSNAMEPMNVENSVKRNSNVSMLEKSPKVLNMVVRRSERLKNSASPSENLGEKPVVEHVNLVENDKEDKEKETPYTSQQVDTLPTVKEKDLETEAHIESTLPEMNERRLEEGVDYLVTVADEFKSKVFRRPNEGSSADFSYKSLYFTAQKKIEALVEENYNLVRKLEFARGKIAVYEAMKGVAAKEVYLVSSLGKATEAATSLSPQRVPTPPPADIPDGPKPKKSHQKQKKTKHAEQ